MSKSPAAGNPDSKGRPYPPPNLRMSDEEAKECDGCKMFTPKGDGAGCCWGYGNLPVDGEWVCDSWEEGSKEPETMEEARIKVKEHFRRKRGYKT